MQTDLEKLKEIFDKAKIIYSIKTLETGLHDMTITAKTGPNNLGYIGFEAGLMFSPCGELKNIGIWEY